MKFEEYSVTGCILTEWEEWIMSTVYSCIAGEEYEKIIIKEQSGQAALAFLFLTLLN